MIEPEPEEMPEVEICRIVATREGDAVAYEVFLCDWLSLLHATTVASILHQSADLLREEADTHGPPPGDDEPAKILRIVPKGTDHA